MSAFGGALNLLIYIIIIVIVIAVLLYVLRFFLGVLFIAPTVSATFTPYTESVSGSFSFLSEEGFQTVIDAGTYLLLPSYF